MYGRAVEDVLLLLRVVRTIGTQNFGQLVAAIMGSYLTEWYNIKGCNFENLPTALLIGHIALPMAAFPLSYFFLPDISLAKM